MAGLLWLVYSPVQLSPTEVEKRAREMGMVYREEVIPWKQAAQDGEVRVVVPPGANSRQVAEVLEQAGVVPDAEAWDRFLCERGLSVRLKPGEFLIPKGADFELLADILTGGYENSGG